MENFRCNDLNRELFFGGLCGSKLDVVPWWIHIFLGFHVNYPVSIDHFQKCPPNRSRPSVQCVGNFPGTDTFGHRHDFQHPIQVLTNGSQFKYYNHLFTPSHYRKTVQDAPATVFYLVIAIKCLMFLLLFVVANLYRKTALLSKIEGKGPTEGVDNPNCVVET